MPPDPKKFLWDARDAAQAIIDFTQGKSFDDFLADRMLRAAVERQFEIIGEALAQLAKRDAALAAKIPHLSRIVAFRNILVHGYATVDRKRVWLVVEKNLPDLCKTLDDLLGAN